MRSHLPLLARPAATLLSGLLLWGAAVDRLMAAPQEDPFQELRRRMVTEQIERRGVEAPSVLEAMRQVPRHRFVPEGLQGQAYVDDPLPIGSGQTISQPYIVALMTSLLELDGEDRVLEIGTGSGYQAAVLAQLAREVFTVEIREELADKALRTLESLGVSNVQVRVSDGYQGWPEEAPFDGILVTAAPDRVPEPLLEQLKVGGKLVIPVGRFFQDLLVITRTEDGFEKRQVAAVRFVPMIGEAEEAETQED